VHDELDIPAGTIRVKLGGGNNGHNGLRSLDRALGTVDYHRVRVGIGRPPGRQDPADYVLQPIAKRDEADVELLVRHAADAVRSLIEEGLEQTQDRFNRSAPST
jgi:PTH1 family peptidyl-tRNA hydrolase